MLSNTFPRASITPESKVLISSISRLFSASRHESLFAINFVEDSSIVSIIRQLFFRSVSPVSVSSTIPSIMSFASVAPYEKNICTGMPSLSKKDFVRRGYSVLILLCGFMSFAAFMPALSACTARTIFTLPSFSAVLL